MLDPANQERRGCHGFMPPGPTSSKAKDVFLLETCTQSTRMHYLYTLLDIQITDRYTEHSHQHKTRVHSVL